jgi:hypothetical protein
MANSQKTNGKQMAGKREDGTFAPGHKLGNRFSKGVSGNRNGRPKLTKLTDALRQQIAETNPDASEETVAEQIARALIREAISGNVQAFREIADRTEGRAPVTLDVGNKDGEPMLITFNFNSNARLTDGNNNG